MILCHTEGCRNPATKKHEDEDYCFPHWCAMRQTVSGMRLKRLPMSHPCDIIICNRSGKYLRDGRRLCFDHYVQPAWKRLFQQHMERRV